MERNFLCSRLNVATNIQLGINTRGSVYIVADSFLSNHIKFKKKEINDSLLFSK